MQGSTGEIGRRPGEIRPGGFTAVGTPSQADMDERLAAFMRTTADQQRRLGHALADALSTITHRVERIEKEPGPRGIESEIAELRTAMAALVTRKDLLALERSLARGAAAETQREEALRKDMAVLARKLEALAEGRSPARLDSMADQLAAGADRLKDISAALERQDETSRRLDLVQESLKQIVGAVQELRAQEDVTGLKAEIASLKAAQAATDRRLVEELARIEAGLSGPNAALTASPAPPAREETRGGALHRTLMAAARRTAELRGARATPQSAEPEQAAPPDGAPDAAVEGGMDLSRPVARSARRGLGAVAAGVFLLAGVHYLSQPSAPAPHATAIAAPAYVAVEAAPQEARVPAKPPAPAAAAASAPLPAPVAFSSADQAALDEFASRLLRGDEIARDRAIEMPPAAPKPITENSRS